MFSYVEWIREGERNNSHADVRMQILIQNFKCYNFILSIVKLLINNTNMIFVIRLEEHWTIDFLIFISKKWY